MKDYKHPTVVDGNMREKFNPTSREDFFNEKGNLIQAQDPYREQETLFYSLFFDDNGYLTEEAKAFLYTVLKQEKANPLCDAAEMIIANRFARNTKGNYSTIYYWR